MNTEDILQLVEIALSMAEAQLSGTELAQTLLDIARRGIEAYQDHTGGILNPGMIDAEDPL
jgi:hypothetical protein